MRGSRNFCQGVQARLLETALTTLFFLVLNLFYSGLSMVYLKENFNYPRFQRGSNIFAGVQHFPGGGGGGGGGPTFSRGGGSKC